MDRSEFDDSVTGTPFEVKPIVPDYSTPGSGQNDDLVFPESVQVNSYRLFLLPGAHFQQQMTRPVTALRNCPVRNNPETHKNPKH